MYKPRKNLQLKFKVSPHERHLVSRMKFQITLAGLSSGGGGVAPSNGAPQTTWSWPWKAFATYLLTRPRRRQRGFARPNTVGHLASGVFHGFSGFFDGQCVSWRTECLAFKSPRQFLLYFWKIKQNKSIFLVKILPVKKTRLQYVVVYCSVQG